ncbi:hypothetical protein HAX54_052858, partial [Datura stramonium]|nr:hypothetical protein [Datura stramonium]
ILSYWLAGTAAAVGFPLQRTIMTVRVPHSGKKENHQFWHGEALVSIVGPLQWKIDRCSRRQEAIR